MILRLECVRLIRTRKRLEIEVNDQVDFHELDFLRCQVQVLTQQVHAMHEIRFDVSVLDLIRPACCVMKIMLGDLQGIGVQCGFDEISPGHDSCDITRCHNSITNDISDSHTIQRVLQSRGRNVKRRFRVDEPIL
ncbi:hypothetical protein Pelo_17013 [Pelomyxa schiedti]|nr:hypothetical protein Pelo_17013 [Pelomyxa schiedti]